MGNGVSWALLLCALALAGCSAGGAAADCPAAIMVDDVVYLLAVLYNNEWYLCTPMESQNQNRHGHRPCRSVCRNTSLDGKPRRVPSSADDGIK